MPYDSFGWYDNPFVPTGSEGGIPWWLSAAELWQMLGMGQPNFFASRPPIYAIQPPAQAPVEGRVEEAIDPKSGLPQSLVDKLWMIDPPEGMPSEWLMPHERFGLPKWMVHAAQKFMEKEGWDINNLPLFFQTLPWDLIIATIFAPEFLPKFSVTVEEKLPSEPPKETVEPPKETAPPETEGPVFSVDVIGYPPIGLPPVRIDPETGMPVYTVDVVAPSPPLVPEPPMPPMDTPWQDIPFNPLPVIPMPAIPGVGPGAPQPQPQQQQPQGTSGGGGGGGGFDIPNLSQAAAGYGAPAPSAFAPNVAMPRMAGSMFQIPQYFPLIPPGIARLLMGGR